MACNLGCRTPTPMPPIDLTNSNWHIREGQAIWKPGPGSFDIAGELLVGWHPDGNSFVQFAKPPLVIVQARRSPTAWEAEFPGQQRRYAGLGQPPRRLMWPELPAILAGTVASEAWLITTNGSGWRVESTGRQKMVLRGYLAD